MVKLQTNTDTQPRNKMTDAEFFTACDEIEMLTDSYSEMIVPSEEGVGTDILYDGLIGWFMHKNDHTLNDLKATIPECIERVKNAPDKNFGTWKFLFQINIFSKYLPDQDKMSGAVAALRKAATYLLSVKDAKKFDVNKFRDCFSGSCYIKRGKYSSDEGTGMGFWNLWTTDIRVRGWTKREYFTKGLTDMKGLLSDIDKLSTHIKSFEGKTFDPEDKRKAKEFMNSAKETIKLFGYLGRGITSAARKISGSALTRLFVTEN